MWLETVDSKFFSVTSFIFPLVHRQDIEHLSVFFLVKIPRNFFGQSLLNSLAHSLAASDATQRKEFDNSVRNPSFENASGLSPISEATTGDFAAAFAQTTRLLPGGWFQFSCSSGGAKWRRSEIF